GETLVVIEGSLPPTFTTSHDEGRLIVDLFQARLAPSVERPMAKGAIRSVRSEARASDVRVVIAFEPSREALIEADGGSLRIRILAGPGSAPPLVVAKAQSPARPATSQGDA